MGADIAASNEITDLARSLSSFFRKHFRGSVSVCRWNRANLRPTRFSKSLRIFFFFLFFFSFFLRRRVNTFNDEFFSLSLNTQGLANELLLLSFKNSWLKKRYYSYCFIHFISKIKEKFKNSYLAKEHDSRICIVAKQNPPWCTSETLPNIFLPPFNDLNNRFLSPSINLVWKIRGETNSVCRSTLARKPSLFPFTSRNRERDAYAIHVRFPGTAVY